MIYLRTVNHDKVFQNLRFTPVIANTIDVTTQAGRDGLSKLLLKRYEGDALNVLPTCSCQFLTGGRNQFTLCPRCGTACLPPLEQPIESLIWIIPPQGIDVFINPTAWTYLSRAMTSSGFNLLMFLTNPGYKPAGKIPTKLPFFMQHGYVRGLNSFYRNFDSIMDSLFKLRLIRDVGPFKNDHQTWIAMNRNNIFCRHLPLPSSTGFVIESSTDTDYLDKSITLAIDAMWDIVSADNPSTPLSDRRKQIRVVDALVKLAKYYSEFEDKTLGKKKGIFRKHIFGGRVHFSARAVITSIFNPHDYRELHLPWGLSLQLLKLHISNKLLRRGFTPNEIEHLFREYALRYNVLLDEIMTELVQESPQGRIPVILQRNPTLHRGSAQCLYFRLVKKDPMDNTIAMPVPVLSAPNADIDGDELNLMLILDNKMHRQLERLEPKHYAMDSGEPYKVSSHLKIPAPVIASIANWMYEGKFT